MKIFIHGIVYCFRYFSELKSVILDNISTKSFFWKDTELLTAMMNFLHKFSDSTCQQQLTRKDEIEYVTASFRSIHQSSFVAKFTTSLLLHAVEREWVGEPFQVAGVIYRRLFKPRCVVFPQKMCTLWHFTLAGALHVVELLCVLVTSKQI